MWCGDEVDVVKCWGVEECGIVWVYGKVDVDCVCYCDGCWVDCCLCDVICRDGVGEDIICVLKFELVRYVDCRVVYICCGIVSGIVVCKMCEVIVCIN